MIKEILEYSHLDPSVLKARSVAQKLLRASGMCDDPGAKNVFKEMAFDALEIEAKLRTEFKARRKVELLRGFKNPEINRN